MNMKKNRSYIFLALIVIVFLVIVKVLLDPYKKKRNEEIVDMINMADSLVNKNTPPQFNTAWEFMDSCLTQDPTLGDYKDFMSRYDNLSNIRKANQNLTPDQSLNNKLVQ
jgi:hypothetical protein